MTCWGCGEAAKDLTTAAYSIGCRECDARAIAQGPAYFEAASRSTITPRYRHEVSVIMAPGESFEAAHKRVRAWASRIAEHRREHA